MIVLHLTLIALGGYLSGYVLYSLMLLFARFLIKEPATPFPDPRTRFGIIIPAHNEELLLARLLTSIRNQEYPASLLETIVVADNCDDRTDLIAGQNSARVLTRTDEQRCGKGYAIKFALDHIDLNEFDAVLIIDADSIIKCDLLRQLDQRVRNGDNAIQCYNGLANPEESWFTRLLEISRVISNEIYHPAKQKLGLSSYLMGNGMCFSTGLLRRFGWNAFSVGEDWEYYARLIEAGETISFADSARVFHRESTSLKQATAQRMRWSSGRFAIARKYGVPLFLKGVFEWNGKKIDASLPLLFPNPSLGMNMTAVGLGLSLLFSIGVHQCHFFCWFLFLAGVQFTIFIIGIFRTRNKLLNFLSLLIAPAFLVWKMGIDMLAALGLGRNKWVRTERKL